MILQCLTKSSHRPTAITLCETFKKFGIDRKPTLMQIKTSQDEKLDLTKQVEALQSQNEKHMEDMQTLQQEITGLLTKLDEERKADVLNAKQYETEKNDAVTFTKKLQRDLCIEKENKKVVDVELTKQKTALQEEKIEHTKQLEILRLQRDNDMQNMQEQLQKKTEALQSRLNEETMVAKAFQKESVELKKQLETVQLQTERIMQEKLQKIVTLHNLCDEERKSANLKTETLKTELNAKSELEKKLTKEIETQRTLRAQQTKAFQEEKFEFIQQLQAFQSQRDCDAINIQKIKEQSQEKILALRTKLGEEKVAKIVEAREFKAKLKAEKMIQSNLRGEISNLKAKLTEAMECQSLDAAKQLENHISVELQEREKLLSSNKEPLQHDTSTGLSTTSTGTQYSGSPNEVSC